MGRLVTIQMRMPEDTPKNMAEFLVHYVRNHETTVIVHGDFADTLVLVDAAGNAVSEREW